MDCVSDGMKLEDIDPQVKLIAAEKRRELEGKFLRVRLKRCERGLAISSEWVKNWRNYIDNSVMRAVSDYLAQNAINRAAGVL